MAFSVDTVFVWVNDLVHSVEWYKTLGIQAGTVYGSWQAMRVDGSTHFALHEGTRPKGDATAVIAFGVDDLDTEIARLTDAGVKSIDAEVTDTGAARFATFRDPDGNMVQLLERYG